MNKKRVNNRVKWSTFNQIFGRNVYFVCCYFTNINYNLCMCGEIGNSSHWQFQKLVIFILRDLSKFYLMYLAVQRN